MLNKQKYFFLLFLFLLFLISCSQKDAYTIKGNIAGLQNPELYILSHSDSLIHIDTISSKNGKFSYKGHAEILTPLLIYMESGNVWITVWAENGHTVSIKGDAKYPELILTKGVETNNLLSEFKTNNKELIKERGDLRDKLLAKEDQSGELSSEVNEAHLSSQIVNLDQMLKIQAENFVEKHPSSVASLVLIQDYILDPDNFSSIKPYLNQIKDEARKNDFFKKLEQLSQRHDLLAVGNAAPDFELLSTKKDTLSLEKYKDKYLLLMFLSTEDKSFESETDTLLSIRKDFSEKELGILTVSLDDQKENWTRQAEEKKFTWDQRIENEGWISPVALQYNVSSLPSSYLIDKNGIIIASGISPDRARVILETRLKTD